MDIELKNCFQEFKDCSLNIMKIVESEDYDGLEIKIHERQLILEQISKMNYTKEEIRKVVQELDILAVSEKINTLINDKKDILRTKLDEISLKKSVNDNYNKSFYNNCHIFNKEI